MDLSLSPSFSWDSDSRLFLQLFPSVMHDTLLVDILCIDSISYDGVLVCFDNAWGGWIKSKGQTNKDLYH